MRLISICSTTIFTEWVGFYSTTIAIWVFCFASIFLFHSPTVNCGKVCYRFLLASSANFQLVKNVSFFFLLFWPKHLCKLLLQHIATCLFNRIFCIHSTPANDLCASSKNIECIWDKIKMCKFCKSYSRTKENLFEIIPFCSMHFQ